MKNIKRYLVYFVLMVVGILVFNDNVYAADCDNYACATCVYENGNVKYNYDIKSNGDGTLQVDFTFSVPNGFRGTIKSAIDDAYFINSDTNKLQCYPIYVQSSGTNPITYTLFKENANGRKQIEVSSNSTNNNKTITANTSDYKLCSFKDTITTKTNATCNVTIDNNKVVNIDCGTFKYNSAQSDIEGVDFFKSCDQISLYMYCNNEGYCTLNKNASFGNTTGGADTETGDVTNTPEYTCSYVGQINGKSLIISKTSDNWNITLPNGNTKLVSTSKIGSNIFPTSNCDDIFYLPDKSDSIKAITATSKFVDETIASYCSGYNNGEVEQFCLNGKCKIENPLCGSSVDEITDYGECPSELRPILYFVKKIGFNTLRLFVPILLIVMGTVDLIRAVMANDDKAMKDAVSRFIRRVLTAILMFFIVTIVTVVMDMIAETDVGPKDDWKACWYSID